MRYILVVICLFAFNCTKKLEGTIISESGKIFPLSNLFENTVVLIFSYECGYSLASINEFNQIKREIESENKSVNFIALTEFTKEKSMKDYPNIVDIMGKDDLNWDKYPKQDELTKLVTKIIVYPQ